MAISLMLIGHLKKCGDHAEADMRVERMTANHHNPACEAFLTEL
jgi:hypothetical protein